MQPIVIKKIVEFSFFGNNIFNDEKILNIIKTLKMKVADFTYPLL
jgi:hypothetical protein